MNHVIRLCVPVSHRAPSIQAVLTKCWMDEWRHEWQVTAATAHRGLPEHLLCAAACARPSREGGQNKG